MSGSRGSITNWWRRLLRRRELEADMRDEMQFHHEARVADLISRGVPAADAERQARIEFGALPHYQEECRAALGYRMADELRTNLRFSIRSIRNNPGFSAAAAGILALAVGMNTVLFTLYSSYGLSNLPIRGVERHFNLTGRTAEARRTGGWTLQEIQALRDAGARHLDGLYTSDTYQVHLLEPEQRQVFATVVSGNFFELLGAPVFAGRTFTPAEENQPLAVLSDAGWRKLMGGDPAAVGKTLRVRSTVLTVVGVLSPQFTGTEMAVPDFWVPLGMKRGILSAKVIPEGELRFAVSGVVRPGVSMKEAEAVLSAAASHFDRGPEQPIARVELVPRSSFLPAEQGMGLVSAMLFAAFLIVLAIACANLANLFLARAAARTHEIAMRLSLGASRWRLIRQLLTESIVIASFGAAAGLALALAGLKQSHAYLFSSVTGLGVTVLPVSIDWRVFCYVAALGVAAGVAFGLLPALEATAPGLTASAKNEHSAFAGRIRPRRLRDLLIAGQVAASLVLLIVAALLIRNIQRVDAIHPGYDLDRVLDLRAERPTPALFEKLRSLPGVVEVAAVSRAPLYGRPARTKALIDGNSDSVAFHFVDEHHLSVLNLAPLSGRGFTRPEAETGARVALVSRATVRSFWPGSTDAAVLGRSIDLEIEEGRLARYEIIGVVPDVVNGWIFTGKDTSAVYLPAAAGSESAASALVRVEANFAARDAIRKACREVTPEGCDPTLLRSVANLIRFPFQAAATVAGALGGLALLITAIGLHGVVGYTVVQRRREIGVHVALGASPGRVIRRFLTEAGWCVLGGIALGLPVAIALSMFAASSVFEIQTFDLGAYAGVPLLLGAIALLAAAGPAVRASRVDPMKSLREE